MNHDFSGVCADQLDKLEKKLESFKKSFIRDYMVGLNVINHPQANEHRGETKQEISDLFADQINKTVIFWTECMNKVQRSLGRHIA